WLQQFMGYPSIDAGMLLAPVGLFAIILSPIVGKNINRMDPRYLASFAFMVFALVLWMRSNFSTQADFGTILVPTLIQGIAMSCFFIPLSVILLSGISPDKIPAASGLSSFVRIVAGSFGTSIATTAWQDRAAMHHAQLAESINSGNLAATQVLSAMGSAGFTPEQALAQVNRLVDQQAYMLGVNDVFYVSALIYLLLIPVVWLSRPKRAGSGGAGSADAAAAH
ncbi:MAG: MFS transporter, partial [Rhodoferax sp.]